MSVNRLEALVDAIGKRNGMETPSSLAYKLRSPLLLRSFARPGKHEIDSEGRRVFESLISGYRASLFDLELKITGQSRAKLKPADPLHKLLMAYGIDDREGAQIVVGFLRKALDDSIDRDTQISYFKEPV